MRASRTFRGHAARALFALSALSTGACAGTASPAFPVTFHGVPTECIRAAAHRYGLTTPIMLSILRTEGGRPGTVAQDSNGTADLGPAQVNTCHLATLENYGYTFRKLTDDPCANVEASAWIFSRCLAATGNVLGAAACYNAGSRPWLAWDSGYVQRFAGFLGVNGVPEPIFQRVSTPPKPPHPQLSDVAVDLQRSGGLL